MELKNKNLQTENSQFKQKVKQLEEECETLNNKVAVNDILYESFKERVAEKYGYDSNDEESDYEPDDKIRLNNRLNFRLKKIEEIRQKIPKNISCDICDFRSISEVGLKSHKTKKHKEK